MSNLVIVAIPEQDDQVWEISTEKVPHLTLLHLGEVGQVGNVYEILQFLEHAANTVLYRFYLDVDRRGELGDDKADVLFFEGWELPDLKRFRANLLQNDNIKKAHLATEQFPDWLPHLTLGYPTAPAKEPKGDLSRRIYSVGFDRVALWLTDYDGPTFLLKKHKYEMEADPMAQSAVDEILAHHGVKGMKWGVRRSRSARAAVKNTPKDVTVTRTPKGKVVTQGGQNQPTHADAAKARVAVQKARKSGLDSLSNQELQVLARRLELEKKVATLADDQLASRGKKFLDALVIAAA